MHTLQLNFQILQYIGMWRPVVWATGCKLVLYNCYSIFMICSFYTFALSQFIDLLVSSDNVNEFAHGSLFLAILAGCGKCASVIKHRKEIIRLTDVLRNDLCKPRNNDEVKIQTDCERDARWGFSIKLSLSTRRGSYDFFMTSRIMRDDIAKILLDGNKICLSVFFFVDLTLFGILLLAERQFL